MRIGLFTMTYPPTPDGVATYVQSFKNAVEREHEGHEVFVITTMPESLGGVRCENNVFRLPSFPFLPYPVYRFAMLPFVRGLRIAKRLDLDIVHAHTPFLFGTMAYIVKKKLDIPLVSTFHTDFPSMKGTLDGKLLNSVLIDVGWKYSCGIYRSSDAVIAPTETMASKLREAHIRTPVHVVWDGIDPAYYARPTTTDIGARFGAEGHRTVLFLGRLTSDKGVYTLLDCAEEVHRRTEAIFLVAGIGPERERLEAEVRRRKCGGYFKVLGYVTEEEKRALLQQADVFVLPSRAETFGMVLLEAMASGTPAVAAASGGILDVVSDGFNGLLFRWGDKNELAQRIMAVLEYGVDVESLVRNGKDFVEKKASITYSVRKTLDIYEGLLGR